MTTPQGMERGMIVTDEGFDGGGGVVGELLGEGRRFAPPAAGALARGAEEAFDVGGKAAAFVAGDVLAGGDDQAVGFPPVRVAGGRLTAAERPGVPPTAQSCKRTIPRPAGFSSVRFPCQIDLLAAVLFRAGGDLRSARSALPAGARAAG